MSSGATTLDPAPNRDRTALIAAMPDENATAAPPSSDPIAASNAIHVGVPSSRLYSGAAARRRGEVVRGEHDRHVQRVTGASRTPPGTDRPCRHRQLSMHHALQYGRDSRSPPAVLGCRIFRHLQGMAAQIGAELGLSRMVTRRSGCSASRSRSWRPWRLTIAMNMSSPRSVRPTSIDAMMPISRPSKPWRR